MYLFSNVALTILYFFYYNIINFYYIIDLVIHISTTNI